MTSGEIRTLLSAHLFFMKPLHNIPGDKESEHFDGIVNSSLIPRRRASDKLFSSLSPVIRPANVANSQGKKTFHSETRKKMKTFLFQSDGSLTSNEVIEEINSLHTCDQSDAVREVVHCWGHNKINQLISPLRGLEKTKPNQVRFPQQRILPRAMVLREKAPPFGVQLGESESIASSQFEAISRLAGTIMARKLSDGSLSTGILSKSPSGRMTPILARNISHPLAPVQYKLITEEHDIIPTHSESNHITQIPQGDDRVKPLMKFADIDGSGRISKVWQCAVCLKSFKHHYTLLRHLPTHTNVRNFKCPDCGKGFRQMSTLAQHRAIHSAARPYVCPVCLKTFNRVSTLISHKKTHQLQKPFVCQTCGKSFHQKGNLRNHEFTHTNERPYVCDMCGHGFNQRSNLICHQNHAHKRGPPKYVCDICGSKYRTLAGLRKHQSSIHDVKHYKQQRFAEPQLNKGVSILRESQSSESDHQSSRKPFSSYNRPSILASDLQTLNSLIPTPNVLEQTLIVPIRNAALTRTKGKGQIPFALFKPFNRPSFLVKIIDTVDNKQLLSPANVNDILGSSGTRPINSDRSKQTHHIQVPVVATFVQRLDEKGNLGLFVENTAMKLGDGQSGIMSSTIPSPVGHSFKSFENEMLVKEQELIDTHTLFSQNGKFNPSNFLELPIDGPNVVVKSVNQYDLEEPHQNGAEPAMDLVLCINDSNNDSIIQSDVSLLYQEPCDHVIDQIDLTAILSLPSDSTELSILNDISFKPAHNSRSLNVSQFGSTSMRMGRCKKNSSKFSRDKKVNPRRKYHGPIYNSNQEDQNQTDAGISDLLELAANTGGMLYAKDNDDSTFQFLTQDEQTEVISPKNSLDSDITSLGLHKEIRRRIDMIMDWDEGDPQRQLISLNESAVFPEDMFVNTEGSSFQMNTSPRLL